MSAALKEKLLGFSFHELIALGIFLGICFAVAGIGSWFTTPQIEGWYASLRKPGWTPPNWVFGPVWSALYTSMAVAAWLVWRRHGWGWELALFGVQLALNMAWSAIFFGLRNPGAALVEIFALWVMILATMLSFWRISSTAGWLMVPYLGWVSFAAVLNFVIWRMNQ
ncbi:MAG: TspO/MBR family protein [Acidobacteriota bacterium]|nr:tryptophan-rich sensory protein [Blastocatellia bacterium]MDW8167155.1 TspO/MBR family protein [Acidobacteriota bacterium]MDW8257523.1 TspO/MBR family protein [Acidobacteriota bacterium]